MPGSSTKLCLQHSRTSLASVSKIFLTPCTKYFQRLLNHVHRMTPRLVSICCVSQLFSAVTKQPHTNNSGRKRLFWTHGFRGLSPWLADSRQKCHGRGKLLSSRQAPVTCLLRLSPTSQHSIQPWMDQSTEEDRALLIQSLPPKPSSEYVRLGDHADPNHKSQ